MIVAASLSEFKACKGDRSKQLDAVIRLSPIDGQASNGALMFLADSKHFALGRYAIKGFFYPEGAPLEFEPTHFAPAGAACFPQLPREAKD